jgi:hypothetical protein
VGLNPTLPRHGHLIVVACLFAGAAALVGAGAVVTVGLMLLNAYVVGDRLLAIARGDAFTDPTLLPVSARVLVGVCVWAALIGLSAPLKVHYAPVYAAGLLVPLALWWRRALPLLQNVRALLAKELVADGGTERVWIALLATTLILHLIIVAKPEVGYDANTMHLQLALLFSEQQRES